MTDELLVARVRKADDNTTISPVDLLKTVIADIEQNEINATSAFIVLVEQHENRTSLTHYRCGMTWEKEIVVLTLAKQKILNRHLPSEHNS